MTLLLIVLSVAVAIFSKLGANRAMLERLFISESFPSDGGEMLPEVMHGQVWRLLTPIFIHFGPLHLLFNMLWLKDLGTMIEKRIGTRVLLALVVIIGVLSNLGQFHFGSPFFGGMSGIVYGLLGYVWMKSKFDPGSGLFMAKQTVQMMILWFFLCLFGVIGNVANAAHAVGLGAGIIWGFTSAKGWTARDRPLPPAAV